MKTTESRNNGSRQSSLIPKSKKFNRKADRQGMSNIKNVINLADALNALYDDVPSYTFGAKTHASVCHVIPSRHFTRTIFID
jgi:hypothetical protein